ncbi:peptidyl-prolyl cis-trans isomerase-like [Brachionus plicatilis]|uniref:Peptidyl-prolyl cis-trans isomerase n=1 Tax=Brachionus plicatilis TaxID=10195 RepID=A0A3M7Q6X4_BRAPC|nr:peptidyl-prolyl cis-trans isomerase-like [Brachionus plicatilis]
MIKETIFLSLVVGVCFSQSIGTGDNLDDELDEPLRYIVTHEAYLDFEVRGNSTGESQKLGRVTIALFGDICPMTVTNFVQICKGFKRKGKKYSYVGSNIHRIVRDFVIQGGDIIKYDGTGSLSIYGEKFDDENFFLSHRSAGWISMANYGQDTNGSQFFITLVPARWLDGHHVVFGKVISGINIIKEIGEMETYKGTSVPKRQIEVVKSGVNDINKYELTEEQLNSQGDL